jgi:hypothetical protein
MGTRIRFAMLVVPALLLSLIDGPAARGQSAEPFKFFREYVGLNQDQTGEIANELGSSLGLSDTQATRITIFLLHHRSNIESSVEETERFAPTAVAGLLVIPILAIFFLSDGENLTNQVIHLISIKDNYTAMRSLAGELHAMLQHYIRAKVILGAVAYLLFRRNARVGLSECDCTRRPCRNPGIHSGSGLDDRSGNNCRLRCPHSLALDLDASTSLCLSDSHGLLDCPASGGTVAFGLGSFTERRKSSRVSRSVRVRTNYAIENQQ